eukprot:448256-Prorocentrum_minimum.AAC.1
MSRCEHPLTVPAAGCVSLPRLPLTVALQLKRYCSLNFRDYDHPSVKQMGAEVHKLSRLCALSAPPAAPK